MLISLYMGLMGANAQSNKYDLNEDGDVNITDVIELVNYILGLNNGNPSGGGNESNAPEGVEAIDLGLPSGTKWASCNVGATKPYEYGGYYAWGETEEKERYDWDTYIHCDGASNTCHDLGSDISGTEYDVAHVKWGGYWRMPTKKEQDELIDNCTSVWTTLNGVKGYKFTGPNGNSIFLPAGGRRSESSTLTPGVSGHFWSGTLFTTDNYHVSGLGFNSTDVYKIGDFRDKGYTVRPVWKE